MQFAGTLLGTWRIVGLFSYPSGSGLAGRLCVDPAPTISAGEPPGQKGLSVGSYVARLAALSAGFWAFTCICFEGLTRLGNFGLAWPPLAIGLAICVVMGCRYAPAIFLGSLLAPMAIGHPDVGAQSRMVQLEVGMWVGLSDTAGSLAGAWIMRRVIGPAGGLWRLRDAAMFLLVVMPVTAAMSVAVHSLALVGKAGNLSHYHSAKDPELDLHLRRVLCNAVAVLLLTPIVVSLAQRPARPRGKRLVEAATVVVSLLATSLYAFTSSRLGEHSAYALAYLPIPFLIWGALQFGSRGSVPLALVACTIAAVATIQGRGPLIKPSDEQTIYLFWGFCIVTGTMALLVGAAVDERAQSTLLLLRSEHRYRQLVESAREGIWLLDSRWRTTLVNPRMAEILGETTESMVGKSFSEFLSESDLARLETSAMRRIVQPDEQQEVGLRRRDGLQVWALVSTTSLRGPAGEVSEVMALVTDISARHQAEDELRASRERLEVAIWGSSLGLWDWDLKTNEVAYSDVWKRQLGYEPRELADTFDTWQQLLHPDDRPHALERLKEYQASPERPFEVAFRMRQRDGAYRWIMSRGYLLHSPGGKPERMIGVHIDIDAQKKGEEDLQQSTQRLGLALEAAQLGTWDWSVADSRLHDSPKMAEIFGVPCIPDENVNQRYASRVHPDDLPRVRQEWQELLRGRGPFSTQVRIVRDGGREEGRDGSQIRWIAARGALSRDAAGRPHRATGVIADITERKLAGAERRKLQDQLHRAQKLESLGILAGGVAHDFSNLLGGILGHIGMLQKMVQHDAMLRPTLDTMEHTTRRAGELTRQLLAYSGRGGMVRQHVDLSAVARDALTLVSGSLSPQAQVRMEPASEPVLTEADITQIRQIAMNLITNASDALETRAGMISIRTGAFDATREYLDACALGDSASPGRYVYLEVADTGRGIAKDDLARIFDPFFTTKFTGRGLGLAAVLGSVRGHNGAIRVESTPGVGTTFRVLLAPAGADAPDESLPSGAAGAPLLSDQSGGAGGGDMSAPRILVVDDESVVRNMAVLSLRQQGYGVMDAGDGPSAIEAFRRHAGSIDAVLLDLTMPGMTGIQTLQALRAISPDVPVVLTSGYSETSAISMPSDGRTSFLQKPFTIEEMVEQIRAVMPRRSADGV